jgi:RNA polymerase sigma factor for flagellar operon FliA
MCAEKMDYWLQYRKQHSLEKRAEIIKRHIPLVRSTIERMAFPRHLPWLEVDDLIAVGVTGLIDALEKFDFKKCCKFSTYAVYCIRGAVLHEMRTMDWVPRSVDQKISEPDQAYEIPENKPPQPVTDTDLAPRLAMSVKQYYNMLNTIILPSAVSMEESF